MSKTEIKLEFIGLAGVNSFVGNTSSSRLVMDVASHFPAHLPLLNPDEKLIKTGIEYELGKYINDVKADHDYVVKAIVPRYREYGVDQVPTYTILAEYEENDQFYLDCLDVDTYKTSHTFFGYDLTPTDDLLNLTYNSTLTRGTILSKTDSYGNEGAYKYGVNVNVAFMSHPSVAEDGFVVSESFIERTKFRSITKRVINITKDTIPINLYGDKENFAFIPNIGDRVREDGLLCALRERNDWFTISDLDNNNISEVDVTFDNLTYVSPNSKVIDVQIVRGNYNKQEFTPKLTKQLDTYAEMLVNYYRNIIQKYEQILAEKKTMYGTSDVLRLTPRLHRFITDCYIKANIAVSGKNKLCFRKLLIDQYRVEVTTSSEISLNLGYKLTDLHAAKGVICRILPDKDMPVDKHGNRADIITDSTSIISRMNLGRAYESYLGAVSRDNRNNLINYFAHKYNANFLGSITGKDVEYIYKYLRGLYNLINPDMVEYIDTLTQEQIFKHFKEIVEDNLYIYYPPDNEYNITDVIDNIEHSVYKPLNDKVSYRDELGNIVETNEDIRIGQLYIMVLEKIANTYSAVSSSKVNNFGFPVKGTNFDKHKYPHSLTPTKTLGETETRILTSFMPPEGIADLFDITLNPIAHKFLIKSILESNIAFNTSFNIDREVVPYGNTKSLSILQHIFTASGFEYIYTPEDSQS